MDGYIITNDEQVSAEHAEVFTSYEKLKLVLHPKGIEILRLLAKTPMYAAEVAKKLKLPEQKVYYHLNKLLGSGILEVVEEKSIRGTVAKRYSPRSLNFGLVLDPKHEPMDEVFKARHKDQKGFFADFIEKGRFEGTIVVGSPDPHGPFKGRSRDSHYAIELAFSLGAICSLPAGFAVELDVNLQNDDRNMIVVGGPASNLTFGRINPKLKVNFSTGRPFEIVSADTGKRYQDDHVGIICKVPSPFSDGKSIIGIAGISHEGTRAAVLGLSRYSKRVLADHHSQKEWYRVVEGYDLDGDGQIDAIEVLE